MQQMQDAIDPAPTPEACASLLMEVAPLVMRNIRASNRSQRADDLTVPRFRALGFVYRHPGASLSGVAEHVGLTSPAASRLVDGLVARGYVVREASAADRRSLALRLSERGATTLEATRQRTQERLAVLLAGVPVGERDGLAHGLETLRALFAPERERAEGTRGDDVRPFEGAR
jgi:DNA-binding MarR family transcriptional regulator